MKYVDRLSNCQYIVVGQNRPAQLERCFICLYSTNSYVKYSDCSSFLSINSTYYILHEIYAWVYRRKRRKERKGEKLLAFWHLLPGTAPDSFFALSFILYVRSSTIRVHTYIHFFPSPCETKKSGVLAS